jgi:hypothetical protein
VRSTRLVLPVSEALGAEIGCGCVAKCPVLYRGPRDHGGDGARAADLDENRSDYPRGSDGQSVRAVSAETSHKVPSRRRPLTTRSTFVQELRFGSLPGYDEALKNEDWHVALVHLRRDMTTLGRRTAGRPALGLACPGA